MTDSSMKGEPLRPADATLCKGSQPAAEVGPYGGVTRPPRRPVRLPTLRNKKSRGEPIVAVTCYDATFAKLVDEAGVDVVLVGDSLGNVIQGQDSTIPVRLEHVIYHCQAVSRGLKRAHLVADLPFMTYYDPSVALPNAARLMAEGGAHAVKLEGGQEVCAVVEALVAQGVPVMGHIGLTPQSVHAMGGHKIQGRGNQARGRLLADAKALEQAGAYSIVLEGIPAELAAEISTTLQIPTIGIGAGAGCDGQILVLYDLLGLNDDFAPKFLKKYAALGSAVRDALSAYGDEVRGRTFPSEEHSYVDTTRASRSNLKAVGQ